METVSALLAICAGNSPLLPGEFPMQRPVTRDFDVFVDLRPNKWLSKQPWGWWFETPSRQLWRHRNGLHHKISLKLYPKLCTTVGAMVRHRHVFIHFLIVWFVGITDIVSSSTSLFWNIFCILIEWLISVEALLMLYLHCKFLES